MAAESQQVLQIDADEEAGVTIRHSSLRLLLLLLRGETQVLSLFFFFFGRSLRETHRE